MKQELPIAVVLLAAGGFFWLSQNSIPFQNHEEPNSSQISGQKQFDSPNAIAKSSRRPLARRQNQQATSFKVSLAGYQQDLPAGEDEKSTQSTSDRSIPPIENVVPTGGTSGTTPEPSETSGISAAFLAKHSSNASTTQQASEYLVNLGAQIRNSIAFETDIAVDLFWRKQPLAISGRYLQIGQGSGHSRFELEIPMVGNTADQKSMTLVKVCDGRFLYTQLLSPGADQTLEFIDLKQIHQRRLASGLTEPNNPMSWIATGGLSSVLENLGSAFHFGTLVEKKWNGITTTSLTGTWKTEQLAELLRDQVDRHFLEPTIQWDQLPVHIPHSVRIECVNRESVGLLPIKIEFFQFDEEERDLVRQLASIRLSAPRPLSMNPADLLKLETDDSNTTDSTHQYVDQVRDFEFSREARLEEATIKR